MTRLSVCGLGVSCNEMNDTPMLLVVIPRTNTFRKEYTNLHICVDQSENVIFNRSANHNTLNITRVKDTCKCVVNKPKRT